MSSINTKGTFLVLSALPKHQYTSYDVSINGRQTLTYRQWSAAHSL